MAIVQNTLIGRSSGRVGNAVFSTWKGRNILKQKPEIVANPRSALQQANRAKFTTLLALGRLLRLIIVMGFKEYSGQMSWLNRFMRTNSYTELLTYNDETHVWEIDLDQVVTAEGSLFPTPVTVYEAEPTTMTVIWDSDIIANKSNDDVLYLVAMVGNFTTFSLGTIARSAGVCTLPIVATNGETVVVSAFFATKDLRIVSNSMNSKLVVTTPA